MSKTSKVLITVPVILLVIGLQCVLLAIEDSPRAELILKGQFRIGPASAHGIIPLGDRYLCIGEGYRTFDKHEVKIFDRQTKMIVFTKKTPMKWILALARKKEYIYALDGQGIFRIPVTDEKPNTVPVLGSATSVDIFGEEASELLHTDTTVAFRTDSFKSKSYKVYLLENGTANKDKVIDIAKLAPEMLTENKALLKEIFIKLVSTGAKTKLVVANTHRLRIYDVETMRIEGDFRYEPLLNQPADVCFWEGNYVLVYYGKLRVIAPDGKVTDYGIPEGYRRIHYDKSQKVFVLTTWSEIAVMQKIGKIEKPYTPPTCIGNLQGLQNIYVEGDKVFLGIDSYDRRDNYVGGGDLLEFEIKINRR